MKRTLSLLLAALLLVGLCACSGGSSPAASALPTEPLKTEAPVETEAAQPESEATSAAETPAAEMEPVEEAAPGTKILVVFFSRTSPRFSIIWKNSSATRIN